MNKRILQPLGVLPMSVDDHVRETYASLRAKRPDLGWPERFDDAPEPVRNHITALVTAMLLEVPK